MRGSPAHQTQQSSLLNQQRLEEQPVETLAPWDISDDEADPSQELEQVYDLFQGEDALHYSTARMVFDAASIKTSSKFSTSDPNLHKLPDTRYVVHLSTIPLPHLVNRQWHNQGKTFCYKIHKGCSMRNCCFIHRKSKNKFGQKIMEKCPCQEFGNVEQICFLEAIRGLRFNYMNTPSGEFRKDPIDPKSIAFCPDADSIFSLRYNKSMRNSLGFFRDAASWTDIVSIEQLRCLLRMLRWFFRGSDSFKAEVRSLLYAFPTVQHAKVAVKNSFQNITGNLVKMFLAFPGFAYGIHDIDRLTRILFVEFLKDYFFEPFDAQGQYLNPENSIILEMKKFHGFVKECIGKQDRYLRMRWLTFDFKTKLGSFWVPILTQFRAQIAYEESEGNDYTLSPAWLFIGNLMFQNRVMGYLPRHAALAKHREFLDLAGTPSVPLTKDERTLLVHSARMGLIRQKVPAGLFDNRDTGDDRDQNKRHRILKDAYKEMGLKLKLSSSYDIPFAQGGKLEEARRILVMMRTLKQPIYARSLDTFEILYEVEIPYPHQVDGEGIAEALFWLSIQLILNWLIKAKIWKDESHFQFIHDYNDLEFCPNPFDTRLVFMPEALKERALVTTRGLIVWALTPGMKMLQAAMASMPEHEVSLRGEADAWDFYKRICQNSPESGPLYEGNKGKFWKTTNVIVSSDWTQASDNMSKEVGALLIDTLMNYVGFPPLYRKLVLTIILIPLNVKENVILYQKDEDGAMVRATMAWTGKIHRGLQMGMPFTKIALQMAHTAGMGFSQAHTSLREKGTLDMPPSPFPTSLPDQKFRIQRNSALVRNAVVQKITPDDPGSNPRARGLLDPIRRLGSRF